MRELRSRIEPGRQPVPFARGDGRATPCSFCCRRCRSSSSRCWARSPPASPAASTGCSSPQQLAELMRSTKAKVIVALGPTPGYEIWENMQAIRSDIPPSVRILSVPGPGGQRPTRDGPRHARRAAARRPSHLRAQGRARRLGRLCPFRRHDRLAQARQAHPSRFRLQVLGQCGGDGAHAPTT